MDYPVPSAPSQPRWPTSTLGAQILIAALLLEALLGVVASTLYQVNWAVAAGERPAYLQLLGPVMQGAMVLFVIVDVVGLYLLGRDCAAIRPPALLAQIMLGVDLGLGVAFELLVYTRNFQLLAFLGPVSMISGIVATGLVLEALLRLRREASGGDGIPGTGAVRGLYWSLAGLRGVLGMAMGYLLSHGALARWAQYGVRLLLTLGLAALVVWLGRSVFEALRKPRAVEDGAGAPLGPEGELDAELARAVAGRGLRTVLLGGAWAVVGIGVTVWSYGSARQGGGRYVVAWGAVVVGVVMIVRGLVQLGRRP